LGWAVEKEEFDVCVILVLLVYTLDPGEEMREDELPAVIQHET